jgi:hypothetical protein
MKRSILFAGLILLLSLSACGAPGEGSTATVTAGLNEAYPDALPVVEQLALGSLRLEETEQAVDESQAATLLPLWQAYQTLSTSDKAAEAEVTALVKQLQGAMTPEQIEAIAAMQLTAEDVTASMQDLGGFFGGRGTEGEGDSQNSGGQGFRFGGGFPGGMPPEGGFEGGMPGGGGFVVQGGQDPNAMATRVAEMQSGDSNGMGDFLNRALISAVIRTLQIKTGEEITAPEGARRFNQAFLDPIVEATGIPAETLQAALSEGGTLADAITTNGGDLEAAKEALRQAYADSGTSQEELDAWIENLLNNPMPQFGRPAGAETSTPEP